MFSFESVPRSSSMAVCGITVGTLKLVNILLLRFQKYFSVHFHYKNKELFYNEILQLFK